MNWLERIDPRSYTLPVILAVTMHLLLLALLSVSWMSETETIKVPAYINAKVIQVESKSPRKASPPKTLRPKPKVTKPKVEAPKVNKPKPIEKVSSTGKTVTEEVEQPKQEVNDQFDLPELDVSAMESDLDTALKAEDALVAAQDETVANSFIQQMRAEISRVWQFPPSARRDMSTTVRIHMVPTGEVTQVTVTESSGNESLDRSVLVAVKKASPLTVPKDSRIFEQSFRVIRITFKPEDARY